MKFFKKVFAVLLTVLIAAGIFTACSVSSASGITNLPADGLVKKAVFEDAKNHSKLLIFQGKSGNITYSWFFDGASIAVPADQNLKLDFTNSEDGFEQAVTSSKTVEIHFNESSLIQAQTTLKIEFPELWNAQKVCIYQKSADGFHQLLEAPLTNDKTSSISIPLSDTSGNLYLAAVDSAFLDHSSSVSSIPESASSSLAANRSVTTPSGETASSPSTTSKKEQSSTSAESKKNVSSSGTDRKNPAPVESQENQKNTKDTRYCTLSIECKTILDHTDQLSSEKKAVLPPDGIILKTQKVLFYEGESVFDVLLRETKKNEIQMEYKATPAYHSSYIEGIHNLYEFDCGELSGWMYQVNGWYPNYGCSRYALKDGDTVCWRYTCDLGRDIGSEPDVLQK